MTKRSNSLDPLFVKSNNLQELNAKYLILQMEYSSNMQQPQHLHMWPMAKVDQNQPAAK